MQEQRSRVREYAQAKAEREGKQADEGQATYSKAEPDAMWAEVNTLKAERETLKGIVDSLKQPLEEHTAAADELWKKKSEKRRELVSPALQLYLCSRNRSILCMPAHIPGQVALVMHAVQRSGVEASPIGHCFIVEKVHPHHGSCRRSLLHALRARKSTWANREQRCDQGHE